MDRKTHDNIRRVLDAPMGTIQQKIAFIQSKGVPYTDILEVMNEIPADSGWSTH